MHDAIDPLAHQAIEALITEHAWLIDHGQTDRPPDLYIDDGQVPGIRPGEIGRHA